MNWGAWALAAVLSAAAAGAAQAGDTGCMWNRLGQPTRDVMLGSYAKGNADGLAGPDLEADITRAVKSCGVDPVARMKPVGLALAGYALQEGAAGWLATNADLSRQALDAAWKRLPPQTQAEFTAWTLAAFKAPGANTRPSEEMVLTLADALGTEDPTVLKHATVYYTGRAMRAEGEAKF